MTVSSDRDALISLAVILLGLVLLTPALWAPLLLLVFSPLGLVLMFWLGWRSMQAGQRAGRRSGAAAPDDWIR